MVKEKIALDTNIVIDIFNNKKNIIDRLNARRFHQPIAGKKTYPSYLKKP